MAGPEIQIFHQQRAAAAAAQPWANPSDNVTMLFFGDSTDAALVLDMCREAPLHQRIPYYGGFGRNCPVCMLPGLHMVQEFIPGVFPHGPYFEGYTDADSPQVNIPKVCSCPMLAL